MEYTTVCFVLLLSVILAMGLDLRVYDRTTSSGRFTPMSLYTFEFHRGDYLIIQVELLNLNPSMTAALYFVQPSGNNMEKEKFILDYDDNILESRVNPLVYHITRSLDYNDISLELELNTTTGPCIRKPIVVGVGVIGDIYGGGSCTKMFGCKIKINLRNIECDVNKMERYTETVQQTETVGNVTEKVEMTSRHEITETTAAPNVTISDIKPFGPTIIAVIIISSISGMALVLLVIICIWKRCWIKRHQTGTPQLPPAEPFYLNMLFKRECEQEIAEIEQHHYEEINHEDKRLNEQVDVAQVCSKRTLSPVRATP